MQKKVTAYLFIKPDSILSFKDHSIELIQKSREETGNVNYNLYEDITDPGKFVFIEVYASEEALANHFESDHLVSFVEKISGLQEKEMIVQIA